MIQNIKNNNFIAKVKGLHSFFSFSKPVSWVNGFEMNKDASKFADGPMHISKAESANSLCKSRWIVGFSSIQEKPIQGSPLSLEQPILLSSPAQHQLYSPYWSIPFQTRFEAPFFICILLWPYHNSTKSLEQVNKKIIKIKHVYSINIRVCSL